MGLFKNIGRELKRAARSKIIRGALRTGLKIATGGTSEAAIKLAERAKQIGKQIGAKQKGGRLLKAQGVAVNVATAKLAKTPKPVVTNSGSEKDEEWNVPQDQKAAGDGSPPARKPKGSTSSTKKRGSGGKSKPKAKAKSKPKAKGKPMSEETKKALRSRPKKAKSSRRSGGIRKGMLDLAAISRARKAAGKMDVDWKTWVKQNPIYAK
jgi:hypothetical protein